MLEKVLILRVLVVGSIIIVICVLCCCFSVLSFFIRCWCVVLFSVWVVFIICFDRGKVIYFVGVLVCVGI